MNYVPFIAIGLCLIAVFTGWGWNQSDPDTNELAHYAGPGTLVGTGLLLWSQPWPAWVKVVYTIIVVACFASALLFTKVQADEPPAHKHRKNAGSTVKVDYPHKGDDFCLSGYEDRQGNRVPLGS